MFKPKETFSLKSYLGSIILRPFLYVVMIVAIRYIFELSYQEAFMGPSDMESPSENPLALTIVGYELYLELALVVLIAFGWYSGMRTIWAYCKQTPRALRFIGLVGLWFLSSLSIMTLFLLVPLTIIFGLVILILPPGLFIYQFSFPKPIRLPAEGEQP